MDFVERMRVRVVDNCIAAHGDIAGLGKYINVVSDTAQPRFRQVFEWFVGFLIFCLEAFPVFRPLKRIQGLSVVPDPSSANSKCQQTNSGSGLPSSMEPQRSIMPARLPAILLAPRPEHHGNNGKHRGEEQPIESEPVPGGAVWSIAKEV